MKRILLVLVLIGCSQKSTAEATAVASASAVPSASPPPAASSAKPSASAAPGTKQSYSGTYSLAPGKIYISDAKDFSNVKQAKDDPAKLAGDGTLKLEVAPDGKVTGTIDSGPASPAAIDGSLLDGEIRGNVRRATPSDKGLTGTIWAKDAAGKLSLAESNASVVREGTLTLKKN